MTFFRIVEAIFINFCLANVDMWEICFYICGKLFLHLWQFLHVSVRDTIYTLHNHDLLTLLIRTHARLIMFSPFVHKIIFYYICLSAWEEDSPIRSYAVEWFAYLYSMLFSQCLKIRSYLPMGIWLSEKP